MEVLDVAPLAVPQGAISSFWDVHAHGAISSTNDAVKHALLEGAPEGFCVTALYQSGGYGRQGRTWVSPIGGLYTSFVLRPEVAEFGSLPSLSLVLSLAVRDALLERSSLPKIKVKWPNDVLCAGDKMCGISLEAVAGGVCVGIGINVFHPVEEQPIAGKYSRAYLLDEVAGNDLDALQRASLVELLGAFLRHVEVRYQGWRAFGFEAYRDEYQSLLAYKGHRVTMDTIEGTALLEGIIRSVDKRGRLLVETREGRVVPATSGEVHIIALD